MLFWVYSGIFGDECMDVTCQVSAVDGFGVFEFTGDTILVSY